MATKAIIYGDEAGEMGKGRFFCIGVLGTRDPRSVYDELAAIRQRTNYYGEVTYKSSDNRRALCAIRWMDWFFSGQSVLKFRVLVKDRDRFNVSYFKNNAFDAGAAQLAYCQTYKEVLNNFADFTDDEKYFVYHRINLQKMSIASYLEGKVPGLAKEHCYPGDTLRKKPNSTEYTLHAELLQLSDLLTSSFRGLLNAWHKEKPIATCWVKKALHQNLIYHLPNLKEQMTNGKNLYWKAYSPYSQQVFTVYNWQPKKTPNRP